MSLKHKFTSPKPDSSNAGLVRPSNWNDDHALQGVTSGHVLVASGTSIAGTDTLTVSSVSASTYLGLPATVIPDPLVVTTLSASNISASSYQGLPAATIPTRIESGSYSVVAGSGTAKIASFLSGTSEKAYVDSNGNVITNTAVYATGLTSVGNTSVSVKSQVGDGASSVGVITDTTVAQTAAGSKLLSVRNAGVEKAYIDKNGTAGFLGGVYIGNDKSVGFGYPGFANVATGSLYWWTGFNAGTKIFQDSNLALNLVGYGIDSAASASLITNTGFALTNTKLVSFRNNSIEKAYIDASGNMFAGSALYAGFTGNGTLVGTQLTCGVTSPLTLTNYAADGASAVGTIINTGNSLNTGGAKLASFRNNTVEKFYVDLNGGIGSSGFVINGSTGRADFSSVYSPTYYRPSDGTTSLIGRTTDALAVPGVVIDNGYTLASGTSKLLSIRNNTVEKVYVDSSGGISWGAGVGNLYSNGALLANGNIQTLGAFVGPASTTLTIRSNTADGVSAIGAVINNSVAMTGSSAKLLSIQNNSVEKAYFDKDGAYNTNAKAQIHGGVQSAVGGVFADGYSWMDPTYFSVNGTTAQNATTSMALGQVGTNNTDLQVSAGTLNQGKVLTLRASLAAGSTGADIVTDTLSTRTTGSLLSIRNNTSEKVRVSPTGDVEITDFSSGVILRSPDGTRWRFTVNNSGVLAATSL